MGALSRQDIGADSVRATGALGVDGRPVDDRITRSFIINLVLEPWWFDESGTRLDDDWATAIIFRDILSPGEHRPRWAVMMMPAGAVPRLQVKFLDLEHPGAREAWATEIVDRASDSKWERQGACVTRES